jgi:hypothetical protein
MHLMRRLLLWVCLACAGCGPTMYTLNIRPAERAVEQAREARAAEHAPYEYHYAKAHLVEARNEATEAKYEDAVRYAKVAEEYAVKARELARRRLREAGR